MTDDTIQHDLTLEPTDHDHDRQRPRTMVYCESCDDWILRSNQPAHADHDVVDPDQRGRKWCTSCNRWLDPRDALHHDPRHDDDLQDEPQQVGHWYRVELTYEARAVVTVPAFNASNAKARAEQKRVDDGIRPDITHQLWEDVTEGTPIHADEDVAEDEYLLP